MKNVLLFIASLLVALLAMALLSFLSSPKSSADLINPQGSPSVISKFSISDAPSSSLKGQILSLSGDITWQSRTATSPASIKSPIAIQQGERLLTGQNGTLRVQFKDLALLTLSPKADLNFTQTLPANLVLTQSGGQVEYDKSSTSTPISVQALGLLINENSPGDLLVIVDKDHSTVVAKPLRGQITLAYNDPNYLSHVVNISQGEEFFFDNSTQEGEIQ